MKEIKSTLDGFTINPNRGSGNSTWQAQLAVHYLLQGYRVEIKDHWENGNNHKANITLYDKVITRLKEIHDLDSSKYKVDTQKLIIELI